MNPLESTKPIHADYFSHDGPVYYNNGLLQTKVKRDALPSPAAAPGEYEYVYPSAKAMLEEELQRRPEGATEEDVSYAHIPRASFKATVAVDEKKYKVRNEYFYRGELNGKFYKDSGGRVHQVHHTITSSWDRSSPGLHMARAVVNPKTQESICYASRPDSLERAKAQAEDIFRKERTSQYYKGIKKDRKTGEYTLTYVVDSLTNPGKIQNPLLLDERESLIAETRALSELLQTPLTIDGCRVHLRPIHVHHTLSVFGEIGKILPDSISGKDLETQINQRGYSELIAFAKKFAKSSKKTRRSNHKLITDTIHFLESGSLSVSERLILVDFLTQICNLPIVHHCKSIVDRTSVAASVSMMNHFIKQGRMLHTIPQEDGKFAVHKFLESKNYRKFFISFMNINHQVSLDARVGLLPDGKTLVGRKELGLNLKSGIFAATGALPFFPDKCLKPSFFSKKRWTRLFIYPLIPALYAIFIVGFVVGSIPIALYFKKKTGSFQKEFFLNLLPLLYRLDAWIKIKNINFEKTFDLTAKDLNGQNQHLLCACPHAPAEEKDGRKQAIPAHLFVNEVAP
jgi:hypothetical protein